MLATRGRSLAFATLIACHIAVGAAAADDARLRAYGAHLAQECTSCHRLDGTDHGIPPIVGWEPERFVATLKLYRQGQRGNLVMVSVARSLDDPQLDALAAYFASLPPPPGNPPPRPQR
jgi:cytochrome c